MKKKSSSPTQPKMEFQVMGTVRDQYQQLMANVSVAAFDKDIRSDQELGRAKTGKTGQYLIGYTKKQFALTDEDQADVFIRVYDSKNKLLYESPVTYNAPAKLEIDVNLSSQPWLGLSDFEKMEAAITPFTGKLPLSSLTENEKVQDISFLTSKTGLPTDKIEELAMAFRFARLTKVEAGVYYGILRENVSDSMLSNALGTLGSGSFESELSATLDGIMRQNIDSLIKAIQKAIADNIIPLTYQKNIGAIQQALQAAMLQYIKEHPVTQGPSTVFQKLTIAGLSANDSSQFISLLSAHVGDYDSFFANLGSDPVLQGKTPQVQAVFELGRLTGDHMPLVNHLVQSEKIQTPDDLKKLAGNTGDDWQRVLKDANIPTPGRSAEKSSSQNNLYADKLEKNFSRKYPTAAFAQKLKKDPAVKIEGHDEIASYLNDHPDFDLLHTRVHQFIAAHPPQAAAQNQPNKTPLANQLKKVQRIFKLAPDYKTAASLLSDNIQSAAQISRMGRDQFVRQYGQTLGVKTAKDIFQKAVQVNAQSTALAANLKSMADASPMQVFPDYTALLAPLSVEIPDLNTLFGDGDYCECDDCNSVYGAAAYLTDILHYLDKRIPSPGSPSVKSWMLYRRPDIGDIDLDCENTNTEIPYIDIACELMEDYINPPLISLTTASLTSGLIDAPTLSAIQSQFTSAGFSNISSLVTANAVVSESYASSRYNGSTMVTETHWMIRDTLVVLKATQTTTGLNIQLVHQTLLGSDEVSANPEYINLPVYQDDPVHGIKGILNNAQRPFSLPFDLFESEGVLYLQKIGINKYDLINIFNPEHDSSGPPATSLLNVAYAYLGVNLAEQTLIFQADLVNQVNYWGPLASGTSVNVDDFENASGLQYQDILNLLSCLFINPGQSIVIQHADLSCNTETQSIINLTADAFDRMHRFIRLWRKTSLPMNELDAIILSTAVGNGTIDPSFALEFSHFLKWQNAWSLGTFQLLALYQDIDTTSSENLYDQLFQNRSVTNPVNSDFSIPSVTAGTLAISTVHQSVISAATGISTDDLVNFLIPKTNGKLSLDNLSYFYRSYLLSEALSISIEDELFILDILNINPFTDPNGTDTFSQQFSSFTTSGFSVDDLNYILRQQDDDSGDYISTSNEIASALTGLQSSLLQIQASTAVQPDPQGTLLTKWLNDPLLNWDASLVSVLFSILNTSDDDEYAQKMTNYTNFLEDLRVHYNTPRLTANLGTLPAFNPADQAVYDGYSAELGFDSVNKQLVWKGYMSTADQGALTGLGTASPAFNTAIGLLFTQSQLTDSGAANVFIHSAADLTTLGGFGFSQIAQRFNFFLEAISPVYQSQQQQTAIAGQISSWFAMDKNLAGQLLVSIPAILSLYTDNGFINKQLDLTQANYPGQFNQYLQLQKIGLLAKKLKLSATDIQWLLPNSVSIGSLDILSLPLAAITGPITTFGTFVTLIDILKFEQFHPQIILDPTTTPVTTLSVYDILMDGINGKPVANIVTDLVTLTGWSAEDLTKLVETPNYLNLTQVPPALPQLYDFAKASVLLRVHECFTILSLLQCSADDAMAWSKNALSYDDAVKLVQTLKTGYSDSDWLAVTQPLQDRLRESKRDALIAYLLANPGSQPWVTDADLYSYFLLDVEMCACQPTSRIVQATNSVQLFVQRCFLALETGITVDTTVDSDWTQWQWMKFYRLWQANYEVFLFPENYIEPELLPVKSSFFTDLENTLLQNEVTEENVEDAFMAYLDSLDGVARLEVKGMWNDDPTNTLYVVARTYGGDPKLYYFRTWDGNTGSWTPWIKVDADISSNQIVPVVYNNRFYIFWAVISEQAYPPANANIPSSTDTSVPIQQPYKYWKIQLAYSEYKNGKWTPKKVSNNDNTGIITADETDNDINFTPLYPDQTAFLFTALDFPQLNLAALEAQYKAGNSGKQTLAEFLLEAIQNALSQNGDLIIHCYYCQPDPYSNDESETYSYIGAFDLDPCRGYPVVVDDYVSIKPWLFDNTQLINMLDDEGGDDLSLSSQPILQTTPTVFNNVIPFQMGFIDRFIALLLELVYSANPSYANIRERRIQVSLGTFLSYFYQDYSRTYYVRHEITDNGNFEFLYSDLENLFYAILDQNTAELTEILSTIPKNESFYSMHRYFNFYHPLVCYFMRTLFTQGISGLMNRDTQLKGDYAYDPNPAKFSFLNVYAPTAVVYSDKNNPVTYPNALPAPVTDPFPGYPREDVDFDPESGYSLYNWELFFHAPLMIAERLDQNQQFEDAETWYRYIFNPSDSSAYASPDKFWITKPFFINVNDRYNTQTIDYILTNVNLGQQDLVNDVTLWRKNPFQPHYIAAYRTIAYQKTTVMKYLDHLIAWGDYLFTQDTMESVNEATQLYLLASQILGPKPQIIPPAYELPVENYYQLEQKLDALSNALVDIENLLPLQTIQNYTGITPGPGMPTLQTLYFCLPANDQLLAYWDTIAQRLYNIRHCLNIDGVFAPLALFAPPINPALLVRATAEGLDLSSILNDLNSPLPNYRFVLMVQKATELVDEVKSLGTSLLSALEKYDAEGMALLRSSNEISLLKAILNVKNSQVKESQASLDNVNKQKELITIRQAYYQGLINAGYNAGEITSLTLSGVAIGVEIAATVVETLAGVAHLIPGLEAGAAGFGGSPTLTVKFGGQEVGSSVEAAGRALRGTAGVLQAGASIASTVAGYSRRGDEWQFQLNLANKELEQIDSQILAAQIRLDIATTEATNQQLQIDNSQAENDLMHSKFTNQDLYSWMITQISNVYFQGYNLAYGTAKKAEQCFRYELGLSDSSYINFGYWDSLKKGLLSGEQLKYDLKNLELAYYDQNKREYELTKHISLAQLDPSALLKLQTNKDCWVNLPEELFDLDYPGQYLRRVKSVSLTIPCVAGPYTSIACTLTLNKNSIRVNNDAIGNYPRKTVSGIPADDPRFRDAVGSIQSIAMSSGQNDNGLFELNFRDERYLPFEGAGAISLWRLQLPAAIPSFDYNTITDVIIHLRYTSREGGDALRQTATTNVTTAVNSMLVSQKDKGLMRLFSARHEFPTAWYQFLHPANPTDQQVLSLNLTPERFPYLAQAANIKVDSVELVADAENPINNLELDVAAAAVATKNLTQDNIYGSFMHASIASVNKTLSPANTAWSIKYPQTASLPNSSPLTEDNLSDLLILLHYELT
jgi:Tc toxin complex TcA C-terminal TcB-binding domain/Neuraminidase-like domain/Salmonella virulence plasmid 28.1kDa A protein